MFLGDILKNEFILKTYRLLICLRGRKKKKNVIIYDKQSELDGLRRKQLQMEFEGEDYVDDE